MTPLELVGAVVVYGGAAYLALGLALATAIHCTAAWMRLKLIGDLSDFGFAVVAWPVFAWILISVYLVMPLRRRRAARRVTRALDEIAAGRSARA